MKDGNLNIDIDNVLGLGRVALCFRMQDIGMVNLPQIHFILYRDTGPEGEDTITGICLELGLVYSNPEQNKAFDGLRQLCIDYIGESVAKGKNREETIDTFIELVKDRKIEDLWELYRMVNFRTALRGATTVDAIKMSIISQLEAENERLKSEIRGLRGKSESESESEKRIQTKDISFSEASVNGR